MHLPYTTDSITLYTSPYHRTLATTVCLLALVLSLSCKFSDRLYPILRHISPPPITHQTLSASFFQAVSSAA